MSIQAFWLKFKGYFARTEIAFSALIVVVSCVSFFLGRFSVGELSRVQGDSAQSTQFSQIQTEKQTANISSPVIQKAATNESTPAQGTSEGGYVASKNGTKYHLPWCGSAKQIKEENKIWFTTKEEAEKAGYTPASNCKGI